jgi:hypothetical protein
MVITLLVWRFCCHLGCIVAPFKVVCLFCLSCWDLPNHRATCRRASFKRSPEYYLTQKVDPRRKNILWQMTTWSGFVTVNHPSELQSDFCTSEKLVQLNRHSKYCHSHFIIAILKTVPITFLFRGWENWSSSMIWTLKGKERTSQAK